MGKLFKSFILLAGISLLLAGCAKEESLTSAELGADQATVTFTASLDNGTATKAADDNDGNAAFVNRCIMEIYYGDELFERKYTAVTNKTATFSTQLVANRTYTVAFWADHVDATTEAGLQVDKYYNTRSDSGLKAVALKGTYAGNIDARDAFALCNEYSIQQSGSSFNAVLTRPFAQINVITTDVATVKKVAGLKPDQVSLTIKNAVKSYNVVDKTAVSGQSGDLTYTASVYEWDDDKSECTLSMDYLFAEQSKGVIDITWAAKKSGNDNVEHSFTNIPYQRNYRTNIKGALLTTQGQWTVTVDPIWTTPENTVLVVAATVDDIDGMNTFVASNPQATQYDVTFSQQPNDAGTPGQDQGAHAVLTTPLGKGNVMNVAVETDTKTLYVGDFENQNSTSLSGKMDTVYTATVNINIPSGKKIETLVINAPSKSVYLNGQLVTSAGTLTNVESTTSQNTLVVEAGQSIETLTVHQGGLEIHGTVTTLVISEDAHDSNPVKVRACEDLSQSVFDIIYKTGDNAHDYIDRPTYVQKAKGTTPETWDIIKSVCITGTEANPIGGYATLEDAFAAVETDGTVTLLEDVTTTSEILVNKKVTLDLNGHSITSGTHSAFQINGGKLTVDGEGTISGDPENCKEIYLKGSTESSATNYSVLTIGQSVTVNCSNGYAVMISANGTSGYGTVININGKVYGYYAAVYVNGTIQQTEGNIPVVNVNGELTSNSESAALYGAGYAKYVFNEGSVVTGGDALYMCSGQIVVNGGTFTGNGANTAYQEVTSGYEQTGDAAVFDVRSAYAGMTADIKGGYFKSVNANAIGSYAYSGQTAISGFISGGYYSSSPEASYIADNYGVVANTESTTQDAYPYTVALTKLQGSGTAADPYQVGSAKDLQIMGIMATSSSTGGYFSLENDVTVIQSDFSPLSGRNVCVKYFNNSTFDGNDHTINLSDVNGAYIFGYLENSTLKDLSVNYDNAVNASIAYHSDVSNTFENITTKGDLRWLSGNSGAFCTYLTGDQTLTNCVNEAYLQTTTGDVTMYVSVFFGYHQGGNSTITMTDCSNGGTLVAGKAGFMLANWAYSSRINFVINNCKNNGLIRSTNSSFYGGAGEYNYLTSDYWDKSGCITHTIDGGSTYTSSTTPKWYDINTQGGLIGTGSFVAGPGDATLALTKNADGTFTITPSTATASYYVVSVGTYVGTPTGSTRVYATETVQSGSATTTLKYLPFVDDTWITANPSAVQGTLAGNTIYTLGNESYYYVGNSQYTASGVNPRTPEMVSVSAFDANDKLLASAPLTE